MEWNLIWKAALIVLIGTLLLRVAGRKTISQMTIAETVIMVAIGSLLIQPVSGPKLGNTFMVGAVLVGTLIIIEFLQVKSDTFEKLFTGKAKVIIENGVINENNLRRLRLTVDQLEMTLRQKNVTTFADVKLATLEPNGQLGLSLVQDAQPVTKKEFNQLLQMLAMNNAHLNQLNTQIMNTQNTRQGNNIFTEVKKEKHKNTSPDFLQ